MKKKNVFAWLLFAAVLCSWLLSACSPQRSTKGAEPVETVVSSSVTVATTTEENRKHVVDQRFYQNDDKMEILLIGNSYSYYWTDELWHLLNAAGYHNVRICNLYQSGATLEQHWTWYENNLGECYLYIVDKPISRPEERAVVTKTNLRACLSMGNWDVISFQQSNRWGGIEKNRNNTVPFLEKLDPMLKSHFPNAEYYWQANWAHEIGKDSYQDQESLYSVVNTFRTLGEEYCRDYGYTVVPLGDAWERIRHNPLYYQPGADRLNDYPIRSLHTAIKGGVLVNSDLSHDGDVGGGQYLNACVWFEILTKQSCIGNSFIPSYFCPEDGKTYTLTEKQCYGLQKAANMVVKGQ
jgi:hypothetical protein